MPKAILSVYDKTGLVDFARELQTLGWSLLASGGTARSLREASIEVVEVSDYTDSPEILDGRVKTLHPAIHGGVLARDREADRTELERMGWGPIDLVAVNLYPFEEVAARHGTTLEEAIENIDIGGVALIRAAAKNFERVTLVCEPPDYPPLITEIKAGGVKEDTRRRLAWKGFHLTAAYDAAIADYLGASEALRLVAYPIQKLRYGENWHQEATLYADRPDSGPLGGRVLQGKELSYNNVLDLDAARRSALSFERPTVCIVKHVSPCGIASDDELALAFKAALASDPVSAFGGVIAVNRTFDVKTASALGDLFVECIIAPGYEAGALELLAKRPNCRLLEIPEGGSKPGVEVRSILGGLVAQEVDPGDPPGTDWQVMTRRVPTESEWVGLRFAWKACQHVKSNAIVFARGEATVGIGGGQPNRVDSVRIAAQRAREKAQGAVMASDAFFPFPDSIEVAAEVGITAVIQPGGSVRDGESIATADRAGMAMVTTGVRHFRH